MTNPVLTPAAIGKITDPAKIRVLLYINNAFVHVSLTEIIGPLEERIKALEEKMENDNG